MAMQHHKEGGSEMESPVMSEDIGNWEEMFHYLKSIGSLRHYEGPLGVFDYNDSEFKVDDSGDFDGLCLHYIGDETDCSKIKVPEGVIDCNHMFSYCKSLQQPPAIPKGVKNCSYMFWGCESLQQAPVIPEGVEDCFDMFGNCKSLQQPPVIPNSVKDCGGMFSGCEELKQVPDIPDGVKNCGAMFFGCELLEQPPVIPNGAKNCTAMFEDCKSLRQAPLIPDSVERCDCMFEGCVLLEQPPVIPDSVKYYRDMFKGCPFEDSINRWGTHKFTKDEQRALLQDKEVTLSDYTTRGGKHVDVKGRFAPYVDENGNERFGFVPSGDGKLKSRPLIDTPSEKRQLSVDDKTF